MVWKQKLKRVAAFFLLGEKCGGATSQLKNGTVSITLILLEIVFSFFFLFKYHLYLPFCAVRVCVCVWIVCPDVCVCVNSVCVCVWILCPDGTLPSWSLSYRLWARCHPWAGGSHRSFAGFILWSASQQPASPNPSVSRPWMALSLQTAAFSFPFSLE